MLLHRRRGSGRGCREHGPAAAPWPERPRRGRWRQGRCKGWGPGPRPRPGSTPRGSCSERRIWPEGTPAGDAGTSRCESAPEMKRPQAEPKRRQRSVSYENNLLTFTDSIISVERVTLS